MKRIIKERARNIRIAFNGARKLLQTEISIQIEFGIAVLVTLAGLYIGLSPTEWILQTLAIGLVMGMEGMNTAVEKTADFIHPGHHPHIGFIKDISAGAVFITAVAAVVTGGIIYFPKLF